MVLFSAMRATCASYPILLDLIVLIMFGDAVFFILLLAQYSPRHPILEHPQSVFLL
jgi:hypothetical protein